ASPATVISAVAGTFARSNNERNDPTREVVRIDQARRLAPSSGMSASRSPVVGAYTPESSLPQGPVTRPLSSALARTAAHRRAVPNGCSRGRGRVWTLHGV